MYVQYVLPVSMMLHCNFLPQQSLYLTAFLSVKKWGAGCFFSGWDFRTGSPQQA